MCRLARTQGRSENCHYSGPPEPIPCCQRRRRCSGNPRQFTFYFVWLGLHAFVGYDMNTCSTMPNETSTLLAWFDSIWSNPEFVHDVKAAVIGQLRELFASKSPDLIYFLTLYNIFREYLGELEEDKIIKTRTGIKETLVWSKLYRFQRDGVLGAIDKIEKYNGCIIADSVGLGKTFEALAIIKYYELRNDRVLVLAPKKLRENWTLY